MSRMVTLLIALTPFIVTAAAFGTIIHVPADQPTIQAGINASSNGDTVLAEEGYYIENIDFLGKAITVSSRFILDNDTAHVSLTIIDGGGTGTGVNISSGEDTTSQLIGFTVTGCGGPNHAGVRCYQGSPIIADCRIISNECRGIILYQSRAILRESEIHGNAALSVTASAIYASQSGPRIEGNAIFASDPNGNIDAIYLGITAPSDSFETIIRNNYIVGRLYGDFHEGGPQHSIDQNLFLPGNTFSSAMNITLGDSGLSIANNTIIGGGGIWIQGGQGPNIRNNIIAFANTGITIWSGYTSIACNNIWECTTPYSGIPDQTGTNGNLSLDPLFCDTASGDFSLFVLSPCAPANNSCGVLIGALDVGCTGPKALIDPDTMYIFQAYTIDPLAATIYFGDFTDGHTVNDIDPASLSINSTITPTSWNTLPSYPGFVGEVMEITFPIRDFILSYGPLWDTTIQAYTVSGEFNGKCGFSIDGEVTMFGHTSGDVNGDGAVNIGDLTYLVDFLFNGGAEPPIPETADLDHSGAVNVADVAELVRVLF